VSAGSCTASGLSARLRSHCFSGRATGCRFSRALPSESSPGFNVVSDSEPASVLRALRSDGVSVGVVAQVDGDKQEDIFDGLAVASKQPAQVLYVPGEQVGSIYPGEVILTIAA